MLLLVGLGNPGDKYARHRHNVGFMAVDAIADANGFGQTRSKFQGNIREGTLGREKVLILKPQTFMNDSGQAVGEAARFYKIPPEDIIVFYDELDLAAGKLRVKTGGGAAGHNGIRSIDSHVGNSFKRIRIGIGHPGDKSRVTNHVLGDFAKADQDWLSPMLDAIASEATFLAEPDCNRFATAVAQKLAPQRNNANQPVRDVVEKERRPVSTKVMGAPDVDGQTDSDNPFADALKKLLGDKK